MTKRLSVNIEIKAIINRESANNNWSYDTDDLRNKSKSVQNKHAKQS